jgi:hypothetical protein
LEYNNGCCRVRLMRNVDAVSLPMSSNEEVNPCLEQGRLFAIRNRMVGVEPVFQRESGRCVGLSERVVLVPFC